MFKISKDLALKIQGYTMLWKNSEIKKIYIKKLRTEEKTDAL